MAVTAFRSELVYGAPHEESTGRIRPILTEFIQKAWDAVWEYPGSVKGDFGEWKFPDWVAGKIEQITGEGGTERK